MERGVGLWPDPDGRCPTEAAVLELIMGNARYN